MALHRALRWRELFGDEADPHHQRLRDAWESYLSPA